MPIIPHFDELRNMFEYTGIFFNGGNPQFIEDDIFKIIIPVTEQDNMQDTMQDNMQDTMQATREKEILRW